IPEAIALMTDRGFSAAPVIDEAEEGHRRRSRHEGFSIEIADSTRVRDIMTPAVFTVSAATPAVDVVKRMCELKVHQLFVVDEDNALIGVISALDIVRRLTSNVE